MGAFALGLPGAIVGFAIGDVTSLTTSAALISLAFVARDIRHWRHSGLSPMTLYAFAGALISAANTVAVLNQETSQRPLYFLYAVDAHLPLAMKIAWIGIVAPILGFHWMSRSPTARAFSDLLPPIRGRISTSYLLPVCVAAAAFGMAAKVTGSLPSLGTLTAVIFLFPHLAAFTLARTGAMYARPGAIWTGLLIAIAESLRALLSAYLRADIISPIFAYTAGLLVGTPSFKVLRSIYMAPIYGVALIFIAYFAAFGDVRTRTAGGVERLEAMAEARAIQEESQSLPRHNLVTRLSSINQLTQIGRVVEEDGFLNGQTLEYLAYAWIPRFLWPEKPTIAKGAWFALRIGQARIYQGRITNSVNMTIPGELYLNYSWIGLLVGTFAFGALIAVLWNAAGALRERENVLGAAFAFYMLWVALGGGADLQIVVTLIAMYVLFYASSIAFPKSPASVGPRGALERQLVR